MKIIPIPMTWSEDGVMKPLPRYAQRSEQQYCVGETYYLAVEEERSMVSHGGYFAELKRIHDNLPEKIFKQFPSVKAFRKRCLIRTGFFTHRHIVCDSQKQAAVIAAMLGDIDEYALIEVRGNVVEMYRARSQSVSSMKKEEFEDSKRKVLDLGTSLIGVSRQELSHATEEGIA